MPMPFSALSRSQARTYRMLSVLMPVYNEVRTLERIVESVLAAPIDLEIELVADLSNLSFLRVLLYQPITESGK